MNNIKLLKEDIKYTKDWSVTDIFTSGEIRQMESLAKEVDDSSYKGQKEVFKRAKEGDSVAQKLIFSKLNDKIPQLYFKNFLGPNKQAAMKKHGDDAFGEFVSLAFDGLVNGYTEKSKEERKSKMYAGKEVKYSPLEVFNPDIFDKNPTDLYEKFAYYYYQYMRTYVTMWNNNSSSTGITKIPGGGKVNTSNYEMTVLDNEEKGNTGYSDNTANDVMLSIEDEEMIDSLRQLSKDPDFSKRPERGGKESASLKDILKTLIKTDTSSSNSSLGDLNNEVFEKLGMKRGTFLNRINDLKEFLDDYDINMSTLMRFISMNGPRHILRALR